MLLFPTDGLFLGRFKILRQIGNGTMGVVYEAEDKKLGTKVALKVLSEASAAGIYRLKQEFRAIADIVHPNLVGLHELFTAQDEWFFTMELVPGDTLLNQLGENPDSLRLRQVFAQLATGIQTIHNAGKLHRDLKPNNVLLTPEDRVVILDFGLVSDDEEGGVGQTLLEDGISGTPTYMAPELTLGRGVSRAVDWYAFGVMLYEAITGKAPFEGNIRTVLTYKAMYDAPRVSSLRQDIPDDLDDLCSRLLEREPDSRPDYDEVISVLGNLPVTSEIPPPIEDVPFIGRAQELASLHEALKTTHRGRPVVVKVRGPSGVGKSTLIEHFLADLRKEKEAIVLRGRCYEKESVPFKACDSLIDSLTHFLRQLPSRQAAQMIPRQVLALSKIFPVLSRLDVVKHTKQRHPLPPNPNELRRIAFLAAKELLANIAAQEPLVIYVDDLQWSDVDGARLLSSFLSHPDAPAMLLIVAHRVDDSGESRGLITFNENLSEVVELDVREIELRALSEQNARKLAGTILPKEKQDLASLIARESRGNPFFISTLSRYVIATPDDDNAPSLENAVKCQVEQLTTQVKEVLQTICISTRPIELLLLKTALPDHNVAEALRTLEAQRLIRNSGSLGWIAAYHDRIRVTVVDNMNEDRIVASHKSIVRALEQTKSPDPVALTEHLLGANNLIDAGLFASQAAKRAEETLAFENAARFYKIAIDHDKGDHDQKRKLIIKMGEALAHAGRRDDAAEAFMLASEDASTDDALELRRRAAQQWINTGKMDKGAEVLNSVLRPLGLRLNTSQSGSYFDALKNRLYLKIRGLDFKQRPASDASKRDLLKLNACEDVMIGFWAASPVQAMAFCSRYLKLALKLGIIEDVVKGLSTEAVSRSFISGQSQDSVGALVTRASQLCKRVDDPETRAYLHLAKGMAGIAQGEYLSAERHLKNTERICLKECTRKKANLEIAQSFLGIAYTRLGKWRLLQEEWDRWMENAKEIGNLHQLTICRTWPTGACRWLASDQPDIAHKHLTSGIKEWPWSGFDLQQVYAKISETSIHLYNGDFKAAFDIYPPLWDRLKRSALHRIQVHRIVYSYSYAQCALSLAATSSRDQKHLLQIAESRAKELMTERSPVADPFGYVIHGSIAALKDNESVAIKWFKNAIEAFDQAEYKLYAAAVRRQLGQMLGGDEGKKLLDHSYETMETENILDKARVSNILVPSIF